MEQESVFIKENMEGKIFLWPISCGGSWAGRMYIGFI